MDAKPPVQTPPMLDYASPVARREGIVGPVLFATVCGAIVALTMTVVAGLMTGYERLYAYFGVQLRDGTTLLLRGTGFCAKGYGWVVFWVLPPVMAAVVYAAGRSDVGRGRRLAYRISFLALLAASLVGVVTTVAVAEPFVAIFRTVTGR